MQSNQLTHKVYKAYNVKQLVEIFKSLEDHTPVELVDGTTIGNGVMVSQDAHGYIIQFTE